MTESQIDRPIKFRNEDGTPMLNWQGKPRLRAPIVGGLRPKKKERLPRASRHGEHYSPGFASSEAGEKGKRNLWFLASRILSNVYPDLVESLHKPMCDFFVQKNPRKSLLLQDGIKNRMLLAPRGHFKTTIDLCDIIQWMLAFPDVTIVLFSGTEQLTARMVDEVKQHFLNNGDFRATYPQWVPDKALHEFGVKGSFTLPCRHQIRREPTLSVTTLKSTRAGAHYDIEKFDDVVTELNSNTAALNAETKRQWSLTLPLLNPGGYRDVIGTLYSHDCFYGPIVEQLRKSEITRCESLKGKFGWKISVESALRREPDKDLFRPEAILFPQRFCVDLNDNPRKQNLQQIWRDDAELFAAQYMNDPQSLASDQFSMPRLRAHVVERADIPSSVNLYMTWDLAQSTREHSDYSVGVLGGFSPNGTLYVVDIVRGQFRPGEVIEQIIQSYRKWPVKRVAIEKDQAVNMLAPGLEARQRALGLYIPIDLVPLKYGGMHPERQILSLGPLLEQNKLWFTASAQHLEEAFREFSRFPKYRHDDICRAVSLMMFYRQHGYQPDLAMEPLAVEVTGAQVYGDGECGAGINCG